VNPGVAVLGLKREDSLGFHGGLTERAILAALGKELKPFGMSPVQYIALGWILSGLASSPTDLAETLSVTKATAVRLIDRMVRDGLVTRESDARDGRAKVLRPSRRAESVWKRVADVGPRNLRRAYRGIDPSDIEIVKQVLARVRANLRR
jgi:DNA-binding MarR family transcriptional regulator